MPNGTVYTIASGKGGVGKTTAAVNVAAAIADAGHRTLVVDADLGMANLADHYGLGGDGPTLHDVLADRADVDATILDVGEYLEAIPGAIDLEEYADIEPTRLDHLVETVRERYEYVVLDGGAGLSYDNAIPLGLADEVVLVTTPSPPAVQDTRKTVALTRRADGHLGGVIVNRVGDDPSLAPATVASRLGVEHLGTVPESAAVPESLRAADPVIWHTPHDPAAEAFRSVTRALTGLDIPQPPPPAIPEDQTEEPDEEAEAKSRGLLARLFGR